MSHSPWGSIQHTKQIQQGVRWVSTASHGGLLVKLDVAGRLLSERAREVSHPGATIYGFAFEEDCSYAVAFIEHPEWKRFLDQDSLASWKRDYPLTETRVDGGFHGRMAQYAEEAIPKLELAIAMTDEEIRKEMRAVVLAWNPDYFGLPFKCWDCKQDMPLEHGSGVCENCRKVRV